MFKGIFMNFVEPAGSGATSELKFYADRAKVGWKKHNKKYDVPLSGVRRISDQ